MSALQSLQLFYSGSFPSEPYVLKADRCVKVKNYINCLELKNSEDWPTDSCGKDFNANMDSNKFINYYFKDLNAYKKSLGPYAFWRIILNDVDTSEDVEFYDDLEVAHGKKTHTDEQVEESIDSYANFEFKEMDHFCDSLDFNENVLNDLRKVLNEFQNIVPQRKSKQMYVLPHYTNRLKEAVEAKDYAKFKGVIEEMVKNKIQIDSTYYNPIFSMHLQEYLKAKKDSSKEAQEKANVAILDVLRDMKSIGVEPGIDFCGFLIELIMNVEPERFEGEVIRVLHIFKSEGLEPNLFVCNQLIKFFVKRKNKSCAFEVFDFMKRMKIKPDCLTYASLIHLCALESNFERALDLYKNMKVEEIQPNKYVYNSMLTAMINQPNTEVALEILKEMSKAGIYTNAWNYSQLKNLFAEEHKWEKALEVHSEMLKMEAQPVKTNHSTFRSRQDADKAGTV